MSVADLLDRTNFLLSKYEKYMPDHGASTGKSTKRSAFEECYTEVLDQLNELTLKAEESAAEPNRAIRAARNAEIRKAKAVLTETSLPRLEKLLQKGKKLTPEVLEDRRQKVHQVKEDIQSIPDGVTGSRRPRKPLNPLTKQQRDGGGDVTLSCGIDGRQSSPRYFKQTEASAAFRQEWEVARARQDKALDSIEKGLGVLKGLGEAMGENLSQQDVMLTEMDVKMSLAQKGLKTNNMKLKGLVHQMRSSKNFCIDVALICILLAMGLWIYQLFR